MAKDRKMRITTDDGACGGNGLARLVVTLLILALIFYAGAYFGLKTEGARSLVEGWLSRRAGMEVKIDRARLAFPLGVAVYGLAAGEIAEGGAGVAAEELRVKFLSGPGMKVEARGVDLVLARDRDGSWGPRYFSRLGDAPVLSLSDLSGVTSSFRKNVALDVSGAVIKWLGEEGRVYAMMEGVDCRMEPVDLPGREMFYYKLVVFKYSMDGAGGGWGREIVREWLAGEGSGPAYMELSAGGQMNGADSVFGKVSTEAVTETEAENEAR